MNAHSHDMPKSGKFSFTQTPLVLALRKAFSAPFIASRKSSHKLDASSSENKMRFESLEPRLLMSADLVPCDPLSLPADEPMSYEHEVSSQFTEPNNNGTPVINLDGNQNPNIGAPGETSAALPSAAVLVHDREEDQAFEVNRGQANDQVAFLSQGGDITLYLNEDGAMLRPDGGAKVKMNFIGANQDPVITGLDVLPGVTHYVRVNSYDRVQYQDVYSGIDLVYYERDGKMEYDWVLAPQADPGAIRMSFSGALSIEIEADGDLNLHTTTGDLVQRAPLLYQEAGGQRLAVDGRFVLQGSGPDGFEVGFEVGAYDHSLALVIDPVLGYSTYLGGSRNEVISLTATDAAGNTYVLGTTDSPDIGGDAGQDDGHTHTFWAKYDAQGRQQYVHVVDNSNEPGLFSENSGMGLTVGADGTAYALIRTFEYKTDLFDVFNTVQDSQLHLVTLGDNGLPVSDLVLLKSDTVLSVDQGVFDVGASGMTMGPDGALYVSAFQLRGTNALEDVFLIKVIPDSGIVFKQPLFAVPQAVTVDAQQNIYLAYTTAQTELPVSDNAIRARPANSFSYDLYLMAMDPTATSILWASYLGGEANDYLGGMTMNPAQPGVLYLTGSTYSHDFPVVGGVQTSKHPVSGGRSDFVNRLDGFITVVDLPHMKVLNSTYLGGGGDDYFTGIALDVVGNVYVSGQSNSPDFPLANPLFGTYLTTDGEDPSGYYLSPDFVVAKLNATLSTLQFSTYFGGTGYDGGSKVKVDAAGTVHVSGITSSEDFPVTNDEQLHFAGGDHYSYGAILSPTRIPSDGVVFTLQQRGALLGAGVRAMQGSEISPIVANFANPRLNSSPDDFEATIDWGDGTQVLGVVERNGAGSASYLVSGTHTYAESGAYPVRVTVRDRVEETLSPLTNQNLSHREGSQIAPAMAQDPTFLRRLVTVSTTEPPLLGGTDPGITLAISENGGRSWAPRLIADGMDTLPAAQGSPDVLFDAFGNLYIAYLSEGGAKVVLLSSKDGGKTFGDAPLKEFSGADLSPNMSRPRLAWNAARNEVWFTVMDTASGELTVAAAPVTGLGEIGSFVERTLHVGDGADEADIAAGPDGGVAVVWEQQQDSGGMQLNFVLDNDGLGDDPFTPVQELLTANRTAPVTVPTLPDVQLGLGPVLAWDNSTGPHRGRLYMGYQDLALNGSTVVDGNLDAYLSWTDDGTTWAEPVRIADDYAGQQLLPTVAVDQSTGVLAAGWYDTSADAGALNVFFTVATSADGGATFSKPQQVAEENSDLPLGRAKGPGDAPRIVFANRALHALWADNSSLRMENNSDGDYEIATSTLGIIDVTPARVQIRPKPISAVKGEAFTGEVATFTIDDLRREPGDFSASIEWGDGGKSDGAVSQPGGAGTPFTVTGSHVYAGVGAYPVWVTVTDARSKLQTQAVSNVTALQGSQVETAIAIDPSNPDRVFAASNDASGRNPSGMTVAASKDGGVTWVSGFIGTGSDALPPSQGDPKVAYDQFGNLFVSYLTKTSVRGVAVLLSENNGLDFRLLTVFQDATDKADQPSLSVGPGRDGVGGSVWLTWERGESPFQVIMAAGADVTGLGAVSGFQQHYVAPALVDGQFRNFGDIVIGPKGEVVLSYAHGIADAPGTGPSEIVTQTDPDGLGPLPFGPEVVVTGTAIGSFSPIAAQARRTIDAEGSLAWDRSGGEHNGRLYLVYTDARGPQNGLGFFTDTQLLLRYSEDAGLNWSEPIDVTDFDSTSAFLPAVAVDQSSGNIAVSWYTALGDEQQHTRYTATISDDGGVTWNRSAVPVAPGLSDASASTLDPNGFANQYGDYTGLAFVAGILQPIWADNSRELPGNPDPQRFEAANARIGIATVYGVPLVMQGVDIKGVAGTPVAALLARFTDPEGARDVVRYKATIDWGDGAAASTGTIDKNDDGSFSVRGDHEYKVAGNYSVKVVVNGPNTRGGIILKAEIEKAHKTVTFAQDGRLRVVREAEFTNVLAVLNDANHNSKPVDFDVTIDWGDGSFSDGVVALTSGGEAGAANIFSITGTHTYLSEQTYTVQVSVRVKADGEKLITSGAIVNGDPSLEVQPGLFLDIQALEGVNTGDLVLVTFTTPDDVEVPLQTELGEYHATINWGDGEVDNNIIPFVTSEDVTVTGRHTYLTPGQYFPLVTLQDDSGGFYSVPLIAMVEPDVTGQVRASGSGLVYNPVTGRFVGDLAITNTSLTDISGPLYVVIHDLPDGVSLDSFTAIDGEGNPLYKADQSRLSAGAGLPPIALEFSNPGRVPINYTVQVFDGLKPSPSGGENLVFEPNRGQANDAVSFIARGQGYSIGLSAGQASLVLRGTATQAGAAALMQIVGANASLAGVAIEPQPGISNYFSGNTAITEVPHFGRIRYTEVYSGIDVEYYGRDGLLEYDWIVRPGANTDAIAMRFSGADAKVMDSAGNLRLQINGSELVQLAPVAYQIIGGSRREVVTAYKIQADDSVGFTIGAYDPSVALVIDPVLVYSTYLGGSGYDSAKAVAVDAAGNTYVTGETGSSDFFTVNPFDPELNQPGTDPAQLSFDSFVTKLDADGVLAFSTYLGGGSWGFPTLQTTANSIAVDQAGHVWVAGYTESPLFPTTVEAPDGLSPEGTPGGDFLTELSADGSSILYSSLFSAPGEFSGIAVDITGKIYAATSGGRVFKLDPAANTAAYVTYAGGLIKGIAVDDLGQAYLTGFTTGTLPTKNAIFPTYRSMDPGTNAGDGFVTKLYDNGEVAFSTYLGGSDDDAAFDIALDPSGTIYVVGTTASDDLPVPGGVQTTRQGSRDGFLVKLANDGSEVLYGTYIGGSSSDYANAVAVDALGRAYIGGSTASLDLPYTANAHQPTSSGGPYSGSAGITLGDEGFAAALKADGSAFEYLTYIGGTSGDEVLAVAVDADGNASYVGGTSSPDLPARNPAQLRLLGAADGFIVRLRADEAGAITLHNAPFTTSEGNPYNGLVAFFESNGSETADQFSAVIDWGDGLTSAGTIAGNFRDGFQIFGSHLYPDAGSHDVFVTLRDSLGRTVMPTSTNIGATQTEGQAHYHVAIDTAALAGTAGLLSFQFNPGAIPGSPGAEARISALNLFGGAAGDSTIAGDASQTSSSEFTLRPSAALNRLIENVTLGTRIEFDLALAGPGLSQPTLNNFADVFALQLLSTNGALSLLSADSSASVLRVKLMPDGSTQALSRGAAVTVAASSRATVANAPINLAIASFSVQEGLEFDGPVATFTNSNPLEGAGEFNARINWGDGSPVANGVISGSTGNFTVSGSHVYQQAGSYPLVVTVIDPDGLEVSAGTGRSILAALTFKNDWGGTSFPPDSPPVSGDFNGDGILDVAVGGFSSVPTSTGRGVAILLGQGDGSFTLAGFQITGQNAVQLAVADFNNDGKLDVAAAISKSGETTVELLLGNGDGTLQPSLKLTALTNPGNIAAADFNHDGNSDLAYTQSNAPAQNTGSSTLKVALGHGDGTFEAPVSTAIAFGLHAVYTADMNADGAADIILASSNFQGTTALQFLRGVGDGSFDSPAIFASGLSFPTSLAFQDFDGDGKRDVAAVDGVKLRIFNGHGDGTFDAPLQIAALHSTSIVAGDFNGDGRPDLATGETAFQNDLGRVQVFINQGAGSFAGGVAYEGISAPQNLLAGDFDRDGHIDLGISGSATVISVIPGIGDGTFASAVRYVTGLSQPGNLLTPQGVATADVNADKHTDAVIIMSDGGIVTELGHGDGTFQAVVSGNAGFASRFNPLLTDVNNDGRLDMVIPGFDSGISIVPGSGDGSFSSSQVNNPAGGNGAVVLADFNQDGRLDVAAAYAGFVTNNVGVSLANADGTFQMAIQYPTGVAGGGNRSIAAGDFNGDSRLDLAVANHGGTLSVLLGNTDGTFKAALNTVVGTFPFNTGISPQSVKAGDFNGDGKLDLAAVGFSGKGLVLPGNGDGTFGAALTFTTNSTSRDLAVGDFNGDGKLDLVTAEEIGGLSVLLGNGDGTFQGIVDYFAGLNPTSVTLGDFNQDGRLDIAAANFNSGNVNSGNVSILLGNANGTFQTAVNYATTGSHPVGIAAGDLNADGKLDLAVLNQSNDTAILLGNGNGTFQSPLNYFANGGSLAGPGAVGIGDLNGDGRADLVAANNLLFGNGDGTFPSRRLFTYLPAVIDTDFRPSRPQDMAAGDLNGDGNIDFAVSMIGTTAILSGNGNGSFQLPQLLAPSAATGLGSTSNRTGMVDMDGDGDLDLVTLHQNQAQGGGAVAVWRNNGSGVFSAPLIRNVPMPNYDFLGSGLDMEIGDLNGDSFVDVVVADSGDNAAFGTATGGVSVMLGVGDGSLAQPVRYLLPSRQTAYRVTLGDLNRDGRPEIAVLTSPFGFDLARSAMGLFTNQGNGTFGPAQIFDHGESASAFLAAGDFNSDGLTDIIAPDSGSLGSTFSIVFAGNGPVLVTDAPVPVSATNINPVAGRAFTAMVATFTDANPFGEASDFTAVINWGDGQTSNGSIRVNPFGGFDVTGAHTYAASGVFTTTVTVIETGEGIHSGSATARVSAADQTLTATGLDVNAVEDLPFAGVVATFADANPNGSIGDFSTIIDWGDGQTSAGAIAAAIGGGFRITGSHTYANPGVLPVQVSIADIGGGSATANSNAQIAPYVNQAAVALDDAYTTYEDAALTVLAAQGVLVNDTDIEGNTLSAALLALPAHGALTLSAGGSFIYIPAANFFGSDSFTYKANDGGLDSNVATVNITVKSVIDAPIANNDSAATHEESPVVIPVLANDTDSEGVINPATVVFTSQPSHGTVKADAVTGMLTYTPVINFFGSDSLGYKVRDNNGLLSNEAVVSIAVDAVNDAPEAINNHYVTNEDTPLIIAPAQGVLTNDRDADGGLLTASVMTVPAHGALTLNSNGSFSYTPATDFSGSDSFRYRAFDGVSESASATVSLIILPVNDNPVVSPLAERVINEGSLFTGSGSFNDTDRDDSWTATIDYGDGSGIQPLTLTGTHFALGHSYLDSGQYFANVKIMDRSGAFGSTGFNVTVQNLAATVQAGADKVSSEGTLISLRGSFTDPGLADTHTAMINWGDGTATQSMQVKEDGGAGTVFASHAYADENSYAVTITVTDDEGASASDALTVTVGNVAPSVEAGMDSTINAGEVLILPSLFTADVFDASFGAFTFQTLAGSFVDPGGLDNHTAIIDWGDGTVETAPLEERASGPQGSSSGVSGVVKGTHVYTSGGNFKVLITVTDNDGGVGSGSFMVAVNSNPNNQSPTANDDAYAASEDSALIVAAPQGVLANDSDTDSNTLSALLLAGPAHGILILSANGSFTYTPDLNYNGADSFTYKANDGSLDSNIATVGLTISLVNDKPTADTIDNQTVLEGQMVNLTVTGHDVDGDTLHYQLLSGPAASSVDPDNGQFTWTATDGDAVYPAGVRLSDGVTDSFFDVFFDINVSNVAPALGLKGDATVLGGVAYQLNLSATDPGQDTIQSWQIKWGDGATETFTGNPSAVQHSYGRAGGNFVILAQATDEDGTYQAGTLAVQVTPDSLPDTLKVTSFTPAASGFKVRFNTPFDPSVINLYDAADRAQGAADITIQGSLMGAIKGSLVIDPDQTGFSFIRSGGLLAPDTYQVDLASGASAFHNSVVGALDGNADGIPGDAYSTAFTATAPGSGYLSLPGFMRGPGQAVDVPATAQGLPVTFQSPGNVSSLEFTIGYNSAYLTITGATAGSSLPTDATISTDLSQAGLARFTIVSPNTPLADGKLNLLNLIAKVPDNARYGAKEIIDLTLVNVNGNAVQSLDDDALHVVGYFGDASGNAQYTTLDVERIQRLVVKLDSGFSAWSQVDPLIIADINASGGITSKDAAYVYQELSGNDRPEIPALPPGIGPIVFNGPDPLVSVPQNLTAQAGSRITVPVNLDIAGGLESVQLSLNYDDSALQLLTVNRGSLTQDFQWFVEKRENGIVSVDLSGMNPLANGQGSLVELGFKVLEGASGPIALDLQSALLNDGWLTLNPAPQPGNDPTDGLIVVDQTIAQPLPRTPVVMASLTSAAQQPALSEAQPEAHPAKLPPEASTQAKPFIGPNLPLPPDAITSARNKRNPNSMPIVIDLDSAWDDGKRGDNTGKRAKASRWQAAFVMESTATQQNPNLDIRITAESLPTGLSKKRA